MKLLQNISKPQILIQLIICFYVFDVWRITNILIMILGLYWLFHGNLKERLIVTLSNRYLVPSIAFFLLNLIGLIWTENMEYGFLTIEKTLTILVFPFVISGVGLGKEHFNQILLTFVLACSAVAISGLYFAYDTYSITGDAGFFYSNHLFSHVGTQGVYFALYSNLSILFLTYLWITRSESKLKIWQVLPLGFFLLAITFLSAGRMSILSLLVCFLIYVGYLVVSKKQYVLGTALIFVLISVLVSAIYIFPNTVQRFKSITNIEFNYENMNPVNQFQRENKKENWNGLTLRLATWNCGIDVIKKHPWFGVGTGDYSDELIKAFEARKFYYMLNMGGGIHNQYMEALISWGIIGLGVFLYGILYPFYLAFRQKNYLYCAFLIIFLLAFLTESVLSRYSGIVLYALFGSILLFVPRTSS